MVHNINTVKNDSNFNETVFTTALKELKATMEILNKANPNSTEYQEAFEKHSKTLAELGQKYKEEQKTTDILQKLVEKISNSSNSSNFIPEDSLMNLDWILKSPKDWRDFFNSLSVEEMAAYTHMLIAFTILLCLYSIVSILFGDFLINKFKLEDKHPLLARLLHYRSKVQNYSIMWNIIIISLLCIGMLCVNYMIIS